MSVVLTTSNGQQTTIILMNNQIKELRQKMGLTQESLAEAVGVRRETIVFLEQGKYNPSLGLAYRVAKRLGKRIEDVFDCEKE